MQRAASSREAKKLQHNREPPVDENLPYSASLGFREDTDLELDAVPEQFSGLNWLSWSLF